MDADQLVAEIARQTGIRLSTADPILAAAVINELLLDKALAKLDRQVQVQADRVTAASTQAVADAKKEAEALLTEAGAAAGMALAELRRETEKVAKSMRTIIRAAWAMAMVGLVVLCGLGGMALAALR